MTFPWELKASTPDTSGNYRVTTACPPGTTLNTATSEPDCWDCSLSQATKIAATGQYRCSARPESPPGTCTIRFRCECDRPHNC